MHEATETFDIGNPNLKIEAAKTVEVGIRRPRGPVPLRGDRLLHALLRLHLPQPDRRDLRRHVDTCTGAPFFGAGGDLNQAIYSQRDATFRGGEFQSQLDVTPLAGGIFGIENQFDVVRATFTDGSNVPRIPPVRVGGGVFWRDANWLARVNLLHAFSQNNIAAAGETPTDGYNLLKAELSLHHAACGRTTSAPRFLTVGIAGNNLLNDDIRNSVSFRKDEVLMPGRSVRFFATLKN